MSAEETAAPAVTPEKLIDALKAAGFVVHSGSPGRYVRLLGSQGDQVLVPLNPDMADYGWRLDEILTRLRQDAARGDTARRAIEYLAL